MSLCETYSRVIKVTIATIVIRICALKAGARLSTAISLLSSRASIPRKTNSPAVRLRKKLYLLGLNLLMNGYHTRPIITGIMPTYVPMRANVEACPTVGRGAAAAESTILSNLVPSSVVIPIEYGSAVFHTNGIITLTSANLVNVRPGSTAAGYILSFTSACAMVTSEGPVFLTNATIVLASENSTFSIEICGSGSMGLWNKIPGEFNSNTIIAPITINGTTPNSIVRFDIL